MTGEHLLTSNDPGPVERFNVAGGSPILLTGDHAGNAVPAALDRLGLGDDALLRHIAIDIGVRSLGIALAASLDATFLAQAYSRLVADCNRDPASAELAPMVSDTVTVPGNLGLTAAERARRIGAIHAPWHAALAGELAQRRASGRPAIFVALHSFTPVLAGQDRPWHVGILHAGHADRFARALIARLRARIGDALVGDNQPYRMDATDYSVPHHCFAAGLPYAEIEVRQDLIGDEAGVARWAGILSACMREACLVTGHAP